jgi:glycosyltransferase involved in cell wall biosynthesis
MRICLIGKFPPIQGGVSMRNYWAAHGLAARGHEVHVVTNAKEAQPPFRMHMRAEDWGRCEASYGQGSVTVHWTDPVDRTQAYIPMASPFVSKLAGIAARLHSDRPFDVIFSFYLEPYGVAGYLAAQMTGVPHVVRMAGSDAGKLWRHPQLEALYDHVLRSAARVITGNPVAARAVQRGVDADRIVFAGGVVVPEDHFRPDGPHLNVAALRAEVAADPDLRDLLWRDFAGGRPYFGVYGKLGESKGSFALLAAMQRLKLAGLDVGLVALAHGPPAVEARFRAQAREFGLVDRIVQLPFLPHWRVPEFIRSCLAVCCLEQDFAIKFHSPIILREVLLCGTCVVAATEVIRKLPGHSRLPHRYGCVAIDDVNDLEMLSQRLAAIVADPAPAADVGLRGRAFAQELQRNVPFPDELERTLEAAVAGRQIRRAAPRPPDERPSEAVSRFRLTQLAATVIAQTSAGVSRPVAPVQNPDLGWARGVLAAIEERVMDDGGELGALLPAVRTEIAIASAECEADAASEGEPGDPLFRLRIRRWAMAKGDLAGLVCERDERLRLLTFDFDVAELIAVQNGDDLGRPPTLRRSHMVVFGRSGGGRRDPLVVDETTARILELGDGTRTVSEIVAELVREERLSEAGEGLRWIEHLFVHGLISLRDKRVDTVPDARPAGARRDDRRAAGFEQILPLAPLAGGQEAGRGVAGPVPGE